MSSFRDDIQMNFIARYGAVGWLIVINVAVYLGLGVFGVGLLLFGGRGLFSYILLEYLALPSGILEFLTKPWTLVTHGFLHSYPGVNGGLFAIFHIVFNMLWLYWLGRIYREYLGDRNVYATHFLGIAAGAAVFLLVYNLSPEFSRFPSALLGASAGVSAVVVATATLLPDFRIGLLLFGPVKLKWVAIIFVVLDFLMIMGSNPGGSLAHLGGAAIGFLFVQQRRRGNDLAAPFENFGHWVGRLFKPRKRKPKMRVTYGGGSQAAGAARSGASQAGKAKARKPRSGEPTQEEIDRILDKMQELGGYEKLSKEEKQKLFKYSQNQQ